MTSSAINSFRSLQATAASCRPFATVKKCGRVKVLHFSDLRDLDSDDFQNFTKTSLSKDTSLVKF